MGRIIAPHSEMTISVLEILTLIRNYFFSVLCLSTIEQEALTFSCQSTFSKIKSQAENHLLRLVLVPVISVRVVTPKTTGVSSSTTISSI